MALVVALLFALSLFEGSRSEDSSLFHRTGEDTTLLCDELKDDGPNCSRVDWSHWVGKYSFVVLDGKIVSSPRSSRLRLNSDCSLTIHNITEEDYGEYECKQWSSAEFKQEKPIHLSVLSVSSSRDPNGDVSLQCSLRKRGECTESSLRWSYMNGTVLSETKNKCESSLTVQRQSQHQRTFSCEFVDERGSVSADFRLEGNSGSRSEDSYLFLRTGEDITLLCDKLKDDGPNCYNVRWGHWGEDLFFVVQKGQIKPSPSSSRLRLNSDCSLTIHNITQEDYGQYECELRKYAEFIREKYIHLSVLSVSSSRDPNGNITLQCTLWKYLRLCRQSSLRWSYMNGTVLSETKDECESSLTVQRQSQHQRTFSCEFVDERGNVSEDFRLEGNSEPSNPDTDSQLVYVISAVVSGVVLLAVAAVVVFFKIKSKRNSPQTIEAAEDVPQVAGPVADPENNVTYAMIDHQKHRAQRQVKEEDSVTYSAVNIKTAADSAIYSNVNKTATA